MKKILGLCWLALGVVSAWGAGVPLILDSGALDTSSAERQAATRALRGASKVATVQKLSAQGTAPWLVQFDDVVQDEWRANLEATGAKIKGYMPENGFLVQATPAQVAAIGTLAHVGYVGEFVPEYKRAAKVRAKLARVKAAQESDVASAYRVMLMSGDDLAAV